MQVEAIQCGKCKRVLFARSSGEWRACTCGQTSISAEEDYLRVSRQGFDASSSETFVLDLGDDISPQLLNEDRINNWNEWGVLPCKTSLKHGHIYEFLADTGDFKEIMQPSSALTQPVPPVVPFKLTKRRKKS